MPSGCWQRIKLVAHERCMPVLLMLGSDSRHRDLAIAGTLTPPLHSKAAYGCCRPFLPWQHLVCSIIHTYGTSSAAPHPQP